MNHPQVLLIPLLMLSDYYLTILGAVLKEKAYQKHFKAEHYELNPLWQKDVAQKKWVNPRHLMLTLVMSLLLLFLTEYREVPEHFVDAVLGALMMIYGIIIGRHLSNLLYFQHLIQKPDQISGQVFMSHDFVFFLSLYQTLMVAIPLLLIAIFSPTPFVLGGVAGMIIFVLVQISWLIRYKKRQKRPLSREASEVGHPLKRVSENSTALALTPQPPLPQGEGGLDPKKK